MKRINLYFNSNEIKELENQSKIYTLSHSTIIDIVCKYYHGTFGNIASITSINKEQKLYAKNKTSAKPKNDLRLTTKEINNLMHIYLNKFENKYLPKEIYENCKGKLRNMINTELQKTVDPWHNYNNYIRMQKRYENEIKRNPMQNAN